MSNIFPMNGVAPRLGFNVFVAPNAAVIGDVEIEDDASVWFGAVLRGDLGPIRVGRRSNVQDLVCVHMTQGGTGVTIGTDVTIGHSAVLHSCTVGNRCLIGMGAILLDDVVVGEGSVVAAGAVVTRGTVIPPGSLVRGVPAKVIRPATPEEMDLGPAGALSYVLCAREYVRTMPTEAAEPVSPEDDLLQDLKRFRDGEA